MHNLSTHHGRVQPAHTPLLCVPLGHYRDRRCSTASRQRQAVARSHIPGPGRLRSGAGTPIRCVPMRITHIFLASFPSVVVYARAYTFCYVTVYMCVSCMAAVCQAKGRAVCAGRATCRWLLCGGFRAVRRALQ
eukprot:41981-Eustigmatos_ZCMA.PRE.1